MRPYRIRAIVGDKIHVIVAQTRQAAIDQLILLVNRDGGDLKDYRIVGPHGEMRRL